LAPEARCSKETTDNRYVGGEKPAYPDHYTEDEKAQRNDHAREDGHRSPQRKGNRQEDESHYDAEPEVGSEPALAGVRCFQKCAGNKRDTQRNHERNRCRAIRHGGHASRAPGRGTLLGQEIVHVRPGLRVTRIPVPIDFPARAGERAPVRAAPGDHRRVCLAEPAVVAPVDPLRWSLGLGVAA
jgi:hypothetical protein